MPLSCAIILVSIMKYLFCVLSYHVVSWKLSIYNTQFLDILLPGQERKENLACNKEGR
jgi:hypothetical protein